MLRSSLRSTFLLVTALCAGASPAWAALDVEFVTLTITVARTTVGTSSYTAALRVEGTDLNNGTIALPSAPGTHLPMSDDGDDLVWEDDYSTEAALNLALPSGNYLLRFNNNTAQATVVYARPSVPSPAISQPSAGATVAPGPVEVLFTRCSVCNLVGDSVEAVLEDDLMTVLDAETLTASSEAWIPQDVGGDLVLPEQSAFVTGVTHTALRQGNIAIADDDNTLLFTGVEVHSDEIDFETGFAPPQGDFCLAANHPLPPAGCTELVDPSLLLLDVTGAVAVSVDGHDVDYTATLEANGALSGDATADLDDNGSNETGPSPIKGKFKAKAGEASSKVSFRLENAGLAAKLKVSVQDALSIPGDQLDRLVRGSGSLGGAKIKESTTSSGPLPMAPLGWLLEFEIDADGLVQNGMLTLEGGRSFPLTGSNKFSFSSNESSLKLQSDPKGIQFQLKKLELDDAVNPMDIDGGALSYKALGQAAKRDIVP